LSLGVKNMMSQKIGKKELKFKKPKYVATRDDVRKLFECASSDQERLLVLLGYQNGFTFLDIVTLSIGAYPLEPWQPYVKHRDTLKDVFCCVSTPEIVQCMQAHLAVRGGAKGESLFINEKGMPLNGVEVDEIFSAIVKRANTNNNSGSGEWSGFVFESLREGFFDVLWHRTCRDVYMDLMGENSDLWRELRNEKFKAEKFGDIVKVMQGVYPSLTLT